MEMTAKGYLDKLIRVRDSIPSEVIKIIDKNEEEIVSLNAVDQIFLGGINVKGNILGKYKNTYSGSGLGYPKQKGSAYNFLETGSLLTSFTYKTDGYTLELGNTDEKVTLLRAISGEFIGLTDKNQERLNWDIIYPDLMLYINKYL
jgi:hypothetical protein